jgi:hypothetical protein
MGIPTYEVGYTSATTRRGDHEVHKGHVVALGINISAVISIGTVVNDRPLEGYKVALLSRGFLFVCPNTVITCTM